VLAGLRLETVNVDINQVTSAIKASNDYTRAYPSLHLAYKFDDENTLTASYSRRVQRPYQYDLNPYRVYLDPYNYRQGNPYLRPQTTDSYEVAYERRHDGTTYQATLYYRETHDAVTDVVEDLGGGVFLTTRENLGSGRSGGGQLVASGKLTKALSYNVSGDAYWSQIDAGNLGFSGTRSAWALSGRANLDWQVTAKDFLQASGNLYGKRLNAQGYRAGSGMLNLGYRHKFDDRLSGLITVRDVLGTAKYTLVTDTPAFHDRRVIEGNMRAVFVGLSYSFGGAGKKPKDPAFDFGGGGPPGP
jgi:outer membrane receptor protein involved in Fe transport